MASLSADGSASLAGDPDGVVVRADGQVRCPSGGLGVDLTGPWQYSDVILVVQGGKIYVSKLVLCMNSPVFRAMFEQDFKENSAKEVPFPGKTYQHMLHFMELLHPTGRILAGRAKCSPNLDNIN